MRHLRTGLVMPLAEQRGGAEMLLRHLVANRPDELELKIWFLEEGPLVQECRARGVEVEVIHAGRLRDVRAWRHTIDQLARAFGQSELDWVFSWMSKAHLYAGPAARRAGLPCGWYQHGLPLRTAWLDRLITFVPADLVLACSERAASMQRELWPRRRTQTLYPCVDLGRYRPERLPAPQEARAQLGLPKEGALVGMVARLQRWKGVHVLVRAMRRVVDRFPDAHCVVVGGEHPYEADYRSWLLEERARLGLTDRVRFVGFQDEVPLWMQAMDVVVHASDAEPFGMVLVEAMALGKPLVAGAAGGPREIITPGEDGLLAPFEDDRMLARQIVRYLEDEAYARQVGEAARDRARHFGAASYGRRFVGAIEEALTVRSDGSAGRRLLASSEQCTQKGDLLVDP